MRATALVALAAFGIGIGPGAPVQPCPKHIDARSADESSASTHAPGEPARDDATHGSNGHADHDGAANGHGDAPCDCLAHCVQCCAPGLTAVPTVVHAAARTSIGGSGSPERLIARNPAWFLTPIARPPPA
ncbi:MAG: hypothetical protein R3195_04820 [Gemmatimonadota bacterium]|nr:hypothetical protein [Gemmatimonadota bacterium]